MTPNRHRAIGIKQVVRLEWMEKAASLAAAGLDRKAVRRELHEFLADQKGTGETGERSEKTRTFAVNNLMRIWVAPDEELIAFRDSALKYLGTKMTENLPIHWAMISATYPFWFAVARQTGRLLNLQDTVTQKQIASRLKEHYGDRPTVSRYARFVLRSFVAWDVLRDMEPKGNYGKCRAMKPTRGKLISLIEGGLHATERGKAEWDVLVRDPAFFPFDMNASIGMLRGEVGSRISVEACGAGEQYIRLRQATSVPRTA